MKTAFAVVFVSWFVNLFTFLIADPWINALVSFANGISFGFAIQYIWDRQS